MSASPGRSQHSPHPTSNSTCRCAFSRHVSLLRGLNLTESQLCGIRYDRVLAVSIREGGEVACDIGVCGPQNAKRRSVGMASYYCSSLWHSHSWPCLPSIFYLPSHRRESRALLWLP